MVASCEEPPAWTIKCFFPEIGAPAIQNDSRHRIAAKAETMGYSRAAHRAFDSQPRDH